MKKLLVLLTAAALVLTGCSGSPIAGEGASPAGVDGEYICVNLFYYPPNPLPSITFDGEGNCQMLVNYFGGADLVYGTYQVRDDTVFVSITDYADAPVEGYIDNAFQFSLIDDDHIQIDRGIYSVYAGDIFTKRTFYSTVAEAPSS